MPKKPLTVDEALEQVLAHTRLCSGEKVMLQEALGRVMFTDATSDLDFPPFDTALMDGFAVRSSELAACSKTNPVQLGVVGHVGAGSVFEGAAREGHCVRIMTGAPVPEGLDAIIKLEDTAITVGSGSTGSVITYGFPVTPGQHIKPKGSDITQGATVLSAGTVIDAPGLGALASTGNIQVSVFKRPVVALLSIGSELVPINATPGAGQIRNSNAYALSGLVEQAGGVAVLKNIVQDDPLVIAEAIRMAAREADFVITTGGSANGDFDFLDRVLHDAGTLIFSDVLMNPAKTQGFGLIDQTPIFSLPGQPSAALCAFELFCRPAILKAGGFSKLMRPRMTVRLRDDIRQGSRFPHVPLYLRARVELAADGEPEAFVPGKKGQTQFGALTNCNALLVLPPDASKRTAGAVVDCLRLDIVRGELL